MYIESVSHLGQPTGVFKVTAAAVAAWGRTETGLSLSSMNVPSHRSTDDEYELMHKFSL